MVIEFGDHTSGFRHSEVVRFINNEVLLNGGSPEFYTMFRSRSWNEIEDQLHAIIIDPNVTRSLKRACTWSALALSVRVAARQREQQARRVGRLQDQVGERETASWTLASELQRLREERDQAATQLVSTQNALQEAMDEREVLRGRLLQAERSATADTPEPRMQQCRSAVWSFGEEEEEEVECRGTRNTPSLESQMPIPTVLSYLPGIPSPWVQAVPSYLRMPVPHPVPLNSQFPLGFPYATPVSCSVGMEPTATAATMAAVVPQMNPATIYPPNLWVSVAPQEAMASTWGQTCHRQNERSEILQDGNHPRAGIIHGEKVPEKPQGTPLHRDKINNNPKENHAISQVMGATEKKSPMKDQVTAALEVSSSHRLKEESVLAQGIVSQGNKTSCIQKKYPGIPRKVVGLGDSINHNTKEDSVTPQETATQVNKTSPILKKYPGILLRRPDLRSSLSCKQKEDLKTSQGTAALGEDNRYCMKENKITFQQMTPLAIGGSPNEKKDQVMMPQGSGKGQSRNEEPTRFQASLPGKNKSYCVNKCPPKQLPPKQKTRQPQETKDFESKQPQGVNAFESKQPQEVNAFESKQLEGAFESKQSQEIKAFKFKQPQVVNTFESMQLQGVKSSEIKQQEKPFLNHITVNWVCPSCKAVNRAWCKGCCYKCAKASAQLEKKESDSKPTY